MKNTYTPMTTKEAMKNSYLSTYEHGTDRMFRNVSI